MKLSLTLLLLGTLVLCHAKHGRVPTPQLPMNDNRLRREADAAAHTPEQVHLSFSGPGAVTVSWVTWPQDDPDFDALTQTAAEEDDVAARLTSSRKLLFDWRTLSLTLPDLTRHHRRHRHRHSHADDDSDPEGHCDRLQSMGLNSVVQWGTQSGDYPHEITGDFDCYSTTAFHSGALHHVTIGDSEGPLPAAATIFYRVGDPKREWSDEITFVAPPAVGAASLPYRLGLLGDLGQTEHSASTVEHLVEQGVDSVLLAGDLSYADGYQPRWDTWGRLVSPHTTSLVWMFTEGNHEIEPTDSAPDFFAYTKRFRVPHLPSDSPSPLYYSYDVAGVHIVMLGSYTDYDRRSKQYAWLQRDLACVDRERTPWVIAAMHAPWYNSNHNHYEEGEDMRVAMEPVLYEHGVDAVIAGHVHAYERSYGVYDNQRDPCGPLYINVGDGGNREGLDFDYYEQPKWSAVRDPSYGHGVMEFVNATHALYTWHRNQDGQRETADEAVLVRDPKCRTDGLKRLLLKQQKTTTSSS